MLTINAPQLLTDPPSGPAALEKPVTVKLGPILFADGQEATALQLKKVGVFVYRSAGSGEELWNEQAQAWQAVPASAAALAALLPVPLAFKEGDAAPWQGTLVAAGQKDGAGQPRFAKAVAGAPAYRVRAYGRFARDGADVDGLSAPSPDLQFVSATEQKRFSIAFATDAETADDCTLVRLVLKTAALQPAATIELRANGAELELANRDGSGQPMARVVLTAAGDIELRPLAGRRVIVASDVEIEHLRYLPAGGTVKQDL